MTDEETNDERDDRLTAIVAAYSQELEAGRRPDRRALIRQHPDLAEDLSACLGGLNFLQSAADQMAATAMDDGMQGGDITTAGPQPLGDYRLMREIGRGGMGVVYEAEQLSLGRRVAVKVLPMAAALDERQLQRFRNEAAAAAQLHHTNIVPVYAVGCERSMHFYAMQLIDGQSLADVIRDLKGGGLGRDDFASNAELSFSAPSASLSSLRTTKKAGFYETVARLGLQAADALHHAHHSGIVHRDIKPANLLLDGHGNLWITDFGLAQFYAAENNLTQSSDRPGTLRYMSPEQASGRAVVLDQRTDVYSLGVTLYELLTLEKAVPGDTREQIQHHLNDSDVRPARSVDPQIPKELETILATATSKEPLDRYATAGALAEDLRRFLADRPILAKPPSLAQHTVRWLRRHRAFAWTAVLVLLLLTAGSALSTVLLVREQAKTQAALNGEQVRSAEAVRARREAERSYAEARDAVSFFTNIAVKEMSDDRPSPEIRRWMLEAAHDYYESFRSAHANDPAAARDLVTAQANIGTVLTQLQAIEQAFRLRMTLRVLADAAVASELKLTDEQKRRVPQLATLLNNGDRGPGDRGPIDRGFGGPGDDGPRLRPDLPGDREQLAKVGQEAARELDDLLSVTQYERLHQILRQVRGPGAFADDEVATALVLTPSQRDALRPLLTAYRSATRRGPPPPDESDDAPASQPASTRASTMAGIDALLDPYQRAAWKAMLGPAFPDANRLDQEGPFGRRGRGFDHHGPNDHGPNDRGLGDRGHDDHGPRGPEDDFRP